MSVCLSVSLWLLCMCTGAFRGHKKESNLLELHLKLLDVDVKNQACFFFFFTRAAKSHLQLLCYFFGWVVGCFAWTYISMYSLCEVSPETRRAYQIHWILWDWSYRSLRGALWVLRIESGPLQEQLVLQPQHIVVWRGDLRYSNLTSKLGIFLLFTSQPLGLQVYITIPG